ncbi:hypothetical protein LIER_02522 [Lithospermum erythrorhizon]|uniref:HMA domain-containing protein n=1 Tax=Lithospermum erythrorhizon TaxID=34254 RepID=A0AAV3NSB9_LITER
MVLTLSSPPPHVFIAIVFVVVVHLIHVTKHIFQKIELKVISIHDQRSQTKIMKAITKLEGVDEVYVDKENKKITIKGEVDPVKVVKQIRKTGHNVEIISVGPPEPPPGPPGPPKTDQKEKPASPPPPHPPLPCYCNQCQLVAVAYAPPYYDERDACSIL